MKVVKVRKVSKSIVHVTLDYLSLSSPLWLYVGLPLKVTLNKFPFGDNSHCYLSAGLTKGICNDQESELLVILLHVCSQR